MTNEEAIEMIKTIKNIDALELDAIEKAIQALEKQIAIEARWEGESMGIKNLNLDNLYCPSCDYILKEDYRYCPDCGQKLDWSDEQCKTI